MIEILQSSPGVFATVAFLFALLVGSFLNVVIHRLPLMMEREWREQCAALDNSPLALPDGHYSLVRPRSACPQCGHMITALENIPVISWLILRGKCSACKTPISARYPAVELLTAFAALAVATRFGFGWESAAAIAFSIALIALSGIDIDHQYLPDSITLPMLWLGLVLSLFHDVIAGEVLFIDPRTAIVGAAAGYLSLWSVYWLFKLVTGKEGMGMGDFKLLAMLGAWLGWQKLPLIIVLSAAVGAAVGIALMVFRRHGREVPIPFGPYLAAAGWVALLWGDAIIDVYLKSSGLTLS